MKKSIKEIFVKPLPGETITQYERRIGLAEIDLTQYTDEEIGLTDITKQVLEHGYIIALAGVPNDVLKERELEKLMKERGISRQEAEVLYNTSSSDAE